VAIGMALKGGAPRAMEKVQKVAPLTCVGLVSLICGGIVAQNAGLLRAASEVSTAAVSAGGGAVSLQHSAWALLGAVALMHSGGFAFGYTAAWACKQPPAICRTVSIETGMQVWKDDKDFTSNINISIDFESIYFVFYSKLSLVIVLLSSYTCVAQNSALSTVLALKAFAGASTLAGAATAAAGALPAATVALPGAISATVHSVRALCYFFLICSAVFVIVGVPSGLN